MDVPRLLDAIRSELDRGGHRFALAGAFALNAYGMGRFTADLDLVAPDVAQPGLIALMERLGFQTLHRSDGFSNHLHRDRDGGRVDFIYVDAGTARRLFAGARASTLHGVEVLVPKPEHLIAMKVQAIRNDPTRRLRDLADIEYLLRLPDVDRDEARRYFERAGLTKEWSDVSKR